MIETLSRSMPVARKNYKCMACVWVLEGGVRGLVEICRTFAEKRAIAIAKAEGWKINKGTVYLNVRAKQDGDLYTFRARPEIDAICSKYHWYVD